jgi:[acyl-carrier-protein] S-malonyltransferase
MNNSLQARIGTAAFAFRGYNVTNLGKTPELLKHSAYGPIVEGFLNNASEICAATTCRKVNLVDRVRRRRKTSRKTYAQALSMIVAVELAQLKLLDEFFGVSFSEAQLAFGYSLGEVTALIAGGVYTIEAVLTPLLVLAEDAADLAQNVRMGVLFSRGPALDFDAVQRLCLQVTNRGHGVIGVSSYLSPNTVLVLGQGRTVDQFQKIMHDLLPESAHLRKNPHRWPPMHTPITWQRNLPNRAGVMLGTAAGGFTAPNPPVLSFVTGETSYNQDNSREILNRWVDYPQRVWDVVDRTMAAGVETIIHVGPEPNILPATFNRLSNNVAAQLSGGSLATLGLRAISRIARRRPWLASMISSDAALLRAPFVEQIVLENWLLEQDVK